MAEEDLIFGKNRHFYGGLEPSNMLLFQANQAIENGDPVIKLQCTLPNDTVYEGQTLCTVAGAVIKRKALDYPADEFDGQLVADVKESGDIFDTSVQNGDTYYYAAFPYTTQGVYNRNPVNRTVGSLSDFYAPGDMKTFTLSSSTNADGPRVRIVAALPDATTVDGVAVNEIGGAMIRKSIATYPVSETDGQLVANLTEDSDFYDTNVELDQTWYYSAFPYTIEGLYNRNPANRASVKVVPIPPGDMINFSARPQNAATVPRIRLIFELPPSVDGLYTVAGVMIKRKSTGYPLTKDDGVLVVNATESGFFLDADIETDTPYYYTAFPYTSDGGYNESGSKANRVQMVSSIYYSLVSATRSDDANPTTRTKTYNSLYDPDTNTRSWVLANPAIGCDNLGDYQDIVPGVFFMPRPCILGFDGHVLAYLNPDNMSFTENGDKVSDGFDLEGNLMVEWPYVDLSISNSSLNTPPFGLQGEVRAQASLYTPAGSDITNGSYRREDGSIADHFYTGMYLGSVDSLGRLRSVSSVKPTPAVYNASTKRCATYGVNAARLNNNGSGYGIERLFDISMYSWILLTIASHSHPESVFGTRYPFYQANLAPVPPKITKMFMTDDEQYNLACLGMEYLYGYGYRVLEDVDFWTGTAADNSNRITIKYGRTQSTNGGAYIMATPQVLPEQSSIADTGTLYYYPTDWYSLHDTSAGGYHFGYVLRSSGSVQGSSTTYYGDQLIFDWKSGDNGPYDLLTGPGLFGLRGEIPENSVTENSRYYRLTYR